MTTENERLEARAAKIEAELDSRKSASEKAADMLLNPETRRRRGGGWDQWLGTPRKLVPEPKPTRIERGYN